MLLAGLPAGTEDALAERVLGPRLHAVRTLPEAIAELERQPWDLAVVDHALAGGGGVDLLRRIRALSWGADLPTLYCAPSALPTETARLLVGALRVARLFFHPLDPGAISEQVRSALFPGADPAPSAPRTAADLASAVAGVWDKFRDLTLDRVAVLEDAAVALSTGELDAELRRRAEREAHKLSGAVGTFGFTQASQVARSVELLLQGDAPLEPEDAVRLSEWVGRLREQLEGRHPDAPEGA